MASAQGANHGAPNGSRFTVTALSRWSSLTKTLPAVGNIKALHVYDFDNTLFKTPTPNPAIWNGPTLGFLATPDAFSNGGWWHDNRILAATGEGQDKEEPRAWEGWWNEVVVGLARLSIQQPDTLSVLLTGRSEKDFTGLVKKIVTAKGLDFDMIGLKPQASPTNQRIHNTMQFKQLFLTALMETYKDATEIRIYEDRPRHTAGFRQFLADFNRRQGSTPTRGRIDAQVIQVDSDTTTLDPVVEVAQVQHMINSHNETLTSQVPAAHHHHARRNRMKISKTVSSTSYTVNLDDSKKLFKLARLPPHMPKHDIKIHANNILICPRPCPANILEKVGGMGSKMLWEVTGTAGYNDCIWAACVRPVPWTASFHTENPVPIVVLALRRGARPSDAAKISEWQPLPNGQAFVFETTVAEMILLRVEDENLVREGEHEGPYANKFAKRKHAGDGDEPARYGHSHSHGNSNSNSNSHQHYGGRNETRGLHSGSRGGPPRGRGGGSGGGGSTGLTRGEGRGGRARGGGGRGGGGRGKGAGFNYRSLDDVDPKNQHPGGQPQVSYDDAFPSFNQQKLQAPPTGPKSSVGARSGGHHGRGRGGRGGTSHRGGQAPPTDLQNYY